MKFLIDYSKKRMSYAFLLLKGIFNPKFVLLTSGLGVALVRFTDAYIFNDFEFVLTLAILIGIDTLTGFWAAWKNNEISSKQFSRHFEKVLIYGLLLVLSHQLIHYKVDEEVNSLFQWFDDALYSTFVFRETLSIFENIHKIRPDLVPTFIVKKLKHIVKDQEKKTENE